MTAYDESQVLGFIADAVTAYTKAKAPVNPTAGVWIARMQSDADSIDYPTARAKQLTSLQQTLGLTPAPVPVPTSAVNFDPNWPTTGNVELALRTILATGLAGPDGSNGQAVIDQMNAKGGIYAGGEFQAHHDGPQGFPTYGFPWFTVSYVPLDDPSGAPSTEVQTEANSFYEIGEFGTPPTGN